MLVIEGLASVPGGPRIRREHPVVDPLPGARDHFVLLLSVSDAQHLGLLHCTGRLDVDLGGRVDVLNRTVSRSQNQEDFFVESIGFRVLLGRCCRCPQKEFRMPL